MEFVSGLDLGGILFMLVCMLVLVVVVGDWVVEVNFVVMFEVVFWINVNWLFFVVVVEVVDLDSLIRYS